MRQTKVLKSYFTSTLSIALVLFLVGIIALLAISTQRITDYFKENLRITLVLQENLPETDVMRIEKILRTKDFVRSTKYISKKQALKVFQENFNEKVSSVLNSNPLPATIDIFLKAEYIEPDKFHVAIDQLSSTEGVADLIYQKTLYEKMADNLSRIGIMVLILSAIMILISVALISNTVRLSIYSRRFIINTMQIVGATRSFIRRPFILIAIVQGIYSSLISGAMLFFLAYTIMVDWLSLSIKEADIQRFILLMAGLLSLGIILTVVFTYSSVNKYLRMSFNKLF